VAIWFTVTGVAWVTGALVPPARIPLWTAAVVIDATIGLAGYPVPLFGRSTQRDLGVSRAHLTERYHQFVIVALGELILTAGLSLADAGFRLPAVAAFVLAFLNALLFLHLYYRRAGQWLAGGGERPPTPGRAALTIAYLHLLVLAAILTASAGHGLVIAHPDDAGRESYQVVLAAGAALFLVWRIATVAAYARRLPWWLPVGLLAAIAVAPALVDRPPVIASAAVNLVLLLVGLAELARSRQERRAARS
jgi:low temperature requirement protein LtrA